MEALPETPMFTDHFTDVEALYTVGRKLGVGNFAKVVQASCKHPMPQHGLPAGAQVAVKIVKKPSRLSVDKVEMLQAEIDVLRSIEHPNLVRLYDVHETAAKLYLVMELCGGGELFDRIVTLGKYTEEDARLFTFKLLNAVLYLHDKKICHRDLKPENILLSSSRADAELKITDFGLSRITMAGDDRKERMLHTRCGTPGYAAPEVLASERETGEGGRRYSLPCDMWAVGVIVYILLCASPPFHGRSDAEMNAKIKRGEFSFPDKFWAHISDSAKDFITGCLTVDPARRLTAMEALQHDWTTAIGVHATTDLFARHESTLSEAGGGAGGGFRGRLGKLAQERRAAPGRELQALLGLPRDEEELDRFRCRHDEQPGELIVLQASLAFVSQSETAVLVIPVREVARLRTDRYLQWNPRTDHSLLVVMSNGREKRFDGFWERDECLNLILAAGRFCDHNIAVEAPAAPANPPGPGGPSGAAGTLAGYAAATAAAAPPPAQSPAPTYEASAVLPAVRAPDAARSGRPAVGARITPT